MPTFDDWMSDFAGATSDTGFDGFDGDGISNGLEHYMGTDPSSKSAAMSNVSSDGASTSFQHPVNSNPVAGVTAIYSWSTDLSN